MQKDFSKNLSFLGPLVLLAFTIYLAFASDFPIGGYSPFQEIPVIAEVASVNSSEYPPRASDLITYPRNNTVIDADIYFAEFKVVVETPESEGLKSVELYIDGRLFGEFYSDTAVKRYEKTIERLYIGRHVLKVVAETAAGEKLEDSVEIAVADLNFRGYLYISPTGGLLPAPIFEGHYTKASTFTPVRKPVLIALDDLWYGFRFVDPQYTTILWTGLEMWFGFLTYYAPPESCKIGTDSEGRDLVFCTEIVNCTIYYRYGERKYTPPNEWCSKYLELRGGKVVTYLVPIDPTYYTIL